MFHAREQSRTAERELAREIVRDPSAVAALQRRTLAVIIASQVVAGMGLSAGISVGALLAQQMLGDDSTTGLPVALFTLGSALSAWLIGQASQRRGRRWGLGVGFTVGGIGALGVVLAAALNGPGLLFPFLFIYGAGSATNMQARYAGTDLARPESRARATSTALVATTVGAVAGPNLVTPLGHVAEALGLPALAGPFLLSAAAYLGAGLVLFARLRPDPLLLAREIRLSHPDIDEPSTPAGVSTAGSRAGIVVAALIMIVGQIVMVAIMAVTPVHIRATGHGMSAVGVIIGLHVAAMYLPSPLTGRLVDRYGQRPVAAASALVLAASGVFAFNAHTLLATGTALVLLGLGWNLGLVSGSAMLTDHTPAPRRASIQGTVDVLISLSGAAASTLAGLVMAQTSYAALGLVGTGIALALLPALLWAHHHTPTKGL